MTLHYHSHNCHESGTSKKNTHIRPLLGLYPLNPSAKYTFIIVRDDQVLNLHHIQSIDQPTRYHLHIEAIV
jgi:hypothetical protein